MFSLLLHFLIRTLVSCLYNLFISPLSHNYSPSHTYNHLLFTYSYFIQLLLLHTYSFFHSFIIIPFSYIFTFIVHLSIYTLFHCLYSLFISPGSHNYPPSIHAYIHLSSDCSPFLFNCLHSLLTYFSILS